jgi:hypothetical protein
MNVFKILASYDGRIYEPSISALLAYLLDPNEDHGLGDRFVNDITKSLPQSEKIKAYLSNCSNYNILIKPESTVSNSSTNKEKKRDIDIVIEFVKNDNAAKTPEFAICIENKIRASSSNDKEQFSDEINGLKQYYNNNIDVNFILICPENDKIKKMFSDIDVNKVMILWKNSGKTIINKSISDIFKDILQDECETKMTEVIYILKSFVEFIDNDFQSEEINEKYERNKYGKFVIDHLVDIYDELDKDKVYKRKDIIDRLINKPIGIKVNENTAEDHVTKAIVNEKNRTNFQIKNPYDKRKNLFYYPNEKDKTKIKKFDYENSPEYIDIYWGEKKERKSEKLSKLLEMKKAGKNIE